jgi:hypothetical protein
MPLAFTFNSTRILTRILTMDKTTQAMDKVCKAIVNGANWFSALPADGQAAVMVGLTVGTLVSLAVLWFVVLKVNTFKAGY